MIVVIVVFIAMDDNKLQYAVLLVKAVVGFSESNIGQFTWFTYLVIVTYQFAVRERSSTVCIVELDYAHARKDSWCDERHCDQSPH